MALPSSLPLYNSVRVGSSEVLTVIRSPHSQPHPPSPRVTSRRFSLRDVELPSNHWEWVGGWIPDAEDDASADEDGWIYGRTPSEIANISEMARSRGRCENVSEVSEQVKNAQGEKEDGATRKSGEWTIHIPVGKKSAETHKGVGGGGMVNGERGGRPSPCDRAAVVRRRRLVRLRTVVRLDGARDSTNKFLETMRRWVEGVTYALPWASLVYVCVLCWTSVESSLLHRCPFILLRIWVVGSCRFIGLFESTG